MEGNHNNTDSRIISKPAEKFIQIGSIFIDLFGSDDKSNDPKSEPFSILGYVSNMRKADWKICWPFPDLQDDHQSEYSSKGAAEGFVSDRSHNLNLRIFPSSSQNAPKQGVVNERTDNADASDLSCQSHHGEKGKKLEVADSSISALIKQREPGSVSNDVTAFKPVNGNLKESEENPAANFQTGKQTSVDQEDRQLTLPVSKNESVVDVDQAHYAVEVRTNRDPSIELSQSTSAASESSETVEKNLNDHHLQKSNRHKNRKFRLLTDLLEENGLKARDFERSPDAELNVRSASSHPIIFRENIWYSDHFRKTGLSQDEKLENQPIPSSDNVDEQIQRCRREKETPVSCLGTGTEKDFSRTSLQTKKSQWSSCDMDGNRIVRKKKGKKSQVVDPCSMSIFPSRDDDQYKVQETNGFKSAAIRVHHNELSARFPHSTSLNVMYPKSEGLTALFPWNSGVIRNASVTQKDVDIKENRIVANPLQRETPESSKKELHRSLNECFNPQRFHKGIVPQGENELPISLPEQNDTSRIIKVTRKDIRKNYLGNQNPPSKASGAVGVNDEINRKMTNFGIPLPNLKLHTDKGWSQLQQKDMCSGSNSKKAIEAQEPLSLTKRQKLDMAFDQGTLDDIPMEIVELMAKNQYERYLHDDENNKHLLKPSNSSRNVPMNDYGNVYRNMNGLTENPKNHKRKHHGRNGGNVAVSAQEVMETNEKRLQDYFSNFDECHFNMNHLQQTHMLGRNESVHSQGKLLNDLQFTTTGSKSQNCLETIKIKGTIMESAPYIWSSTTPNSLSYGYQRVPTLPTDGEKLSNVRLLQTENATPQNYQNHHSANLENHGGSYSFELCSQGASENPYYYYPNVVENHQNLAGSVKTYPNETIPAMHLLSLVDSGMQSIANAHKLSRKPHVPHPPKCKKGMDIGLNKTNYAINYPQSAFYDEVHIPEKSHCHSPAASANSESACKFHHFNEKSADFTGWAPLKSQSRGKTKCLDSYSWHNGEKPPKSVFRRCGLEANNAIFSVNGIHRSLVLDSEVSTLADDMEKNSNDCKMVTKAKTPQRQRTLETEICSVNKNPADFSLPEAGNLYMIGAEDFNFGRTVHSNNRPTSINFCGFKRQRIM